MIITVIGGSGSGKSEFAENLLLSVSRNLNQQQTKPCRKYYIATMEPFGEEGLERIMRHQKLRSGKGFETIECYENLQQAEKYIEEDAVVLLECMSNLTANIMFSEYGKGKEPKELTGYVMEMIRSLSKKCRDLCIVTNNVFEDGIFHELETEKYNIFLGGVNREIAKISDQVIEVVYSKPYYLKKERG